MENCVICDKDQEEVVCDSCNQWMTENEQYNYEKKNIDADWLNHFLEV